MTGLRIVHAHGDRITVTDPATGVELLSYVYRPEAACSSGTPGAGVMAQFSLL